MVVAHLPVSRDQIAAFCRRHGIRRLSLFGSVLRDDFGPGERSWIAILDAKDDLSALFGGREVDFIQRSSLNRWVPARVFQEEVVLYDRDRQEVDGREAIAPRSPRGPSMSERDILYFGHMLDAAREAMEIAQDADRTTFDSDRRLRPALTHLVQIVGEAARTVSPEGRAAHPSIPWRQIVGMRQVLVHQYDGVQEPKVWETVTDDLPVLLATIERFLPSRRPTSIRPWTNAPPSALAGQPPRPVSAVAPRSAGAASRRRHRRRSTPGDGEPQGGRIDPEREREGMSGRMNRVVRRERGRASAPPANE